MSNEPSCGASPSNDGLGPLLPECAGQPRTMTMNMPWELERGHWYSPAAVKERVDAAVAAERERWIVKIDAADKAMQEAGAALVGCSTSPEDAAQPLRELADARMALRA